MPSEKTFKQRRSFGARRGPGSGRSGCREGWRSGRGWCLAGPGRGGARSDGAGGVSVSGGSVPGVVRARSVALAGDRRRAPGPLRDWRSDPGGGGYRRRSALPCVLSGAQVRAPRKPRSSTQPPVFPQLSGDVCVLERWPLSHNGNLTAVLFA